MNQKVSRKDQAYQYIRKAILTEKYLPNMPIPELAVSEELGISRTPIREAMRELEREGLIVSYPARGSFVAAITPYDVEEIGELRILLEGYGLEKGFSRISTRRLAELEEDFTKAYEKQDWELTHQTDRVLHDLIVCSAGSRRLQMFTEVLNGQIERIRFTGAMDEGRSELSYREHVEIIHQIQAGDKEKSVEALRQHLRSVTRSAIEVAKNRELNWK